MFDSKYNTSVPGSFADAYMSVTKAENGFTLTANGAVRVYGSLDEALTDLKSYFADK